MKKYITIAALLAAGTAFANAETATGSVVQGKLDSALTTSGYETGESYALSFVIESFGGFHNGNKGILILDDTEGSSYYLIGQDDANFADTGKRYFGLSTILTDAPAAENWTKSVEGATHTLTSTEDELPLGWVTTSDTVNSEGKYSSQSRAIGDWMKVTLSSNGTDSQLKLEYAGTNIVDVVKFVGTDIDLNNVELGAGLKASGSFSAATVNIDGVTYNIPEPSAFGLLAGIGALALVASRRRRK